MIEINWSPTKFQLQKFGRGFLTIFVCVSLVKIVFPLENTFAQNAPMALGSLIIGLIGGLWCMTGHSSSAIIYRIWMGIGFALGAVVSRILFAIFFYGLITPMGLFFRLTGRDRLSLKKQSLNSYWRSLPPRQGGYERLF